MKVTVDGSTFKVPENSQLYKFIMCAIQEKDLQEIISTDDNRKLKRVKRTSEEIDDSLESPGYSPERHPTPKQTPYHPPVLTMGTGRRLPSPSF
jgi:hypothetical protein